MYLCASQQLLMGVNSVALLSTSLNNPFDMSNLTRDWPEMVTQIEAMGRDEFVYTQIAQETSLEELSGLQDVLTVFDAEQWQEHPEAASTIHRILATEIRQHPSLYQPDVPASLEAELLKADGAIYFGQHHPHNAYITRDIHDAIAIPGPNEQTVGHAVLCAGGAQTLIEAHAFADGSRIAASTDKGLRSEQQDGFYYAFFENSAGVMVKIMVGVDGLGGYMGSDLAASAFLQGIHAALLFSQHVGVFPDASYLYNSGRKAMLTQCEMGIADPQASCSASIVVVAGNYASIATAGDTTVTHSRLDQEERYTVLGYSHVDCIDEPFIVRYHANDDPTLYFINNLRPRDRINIGSDGWWENLLGRSYKYQCSRDLRAKEDKPKPTDATFEDLAWILRHSSGQLLSTQYFLGLTMRDEEAAPYLNIASLDLFLPGRRVKDNLLVMDYEHGDVESPEGLFEKMNKGGNLEPISPL